MTSTVLRTVDDLTAAWLSNALGQPVCGFEVRPIGTGQSSGTFLVTLDWDGEVKSVVLKLADINPAVRATGVSMGMYEREVRFYRDVAHRLPDTALAHCYVAAYDATEGLFTLLLEDGSPAHPGDQIKGCTVDEARKVVRELARLQAAVFGDTGLAEWLAKPPPATGMMLGMLLPLYYERFGTRVSDAHRRVVDRFIQCFDAWFADRREPRGLAHSDFRLDNILFGEPGSSHDITIVDWATLEWGPLTKDLAFFIGGNLKTEDRRAHEEELVRAYHDELVASGVTGFSADECWRGYRLNSFAGVLMAVGAPMVVAATERGDDMFMTMLSRHCQQVLDLGTLDLLEEVQSAAIKVDPANESRHTPGVDRYWNESFYLDAISDDGTLGAYLRMGFVPKLNRTVYTAYVVGTDFSAIGVLDYVAPLPASGYAVKTDQFSSDMVVEEPLKRVRVTLSGTGRSFADPAGELRGEKGAPTAVGFDLVWETAGTPYMYQLTTRYELPCHVTGTIKVGDKVLAFKGPGQRDHSWGSRDWWALDWTWVSAHLDDGTRMQTVELRFPGMPITTVGYEQNGAKLTEIRGMNATYEIPANRMPGRTVATLDPTATQLTWEPLAYGPLRLEAPDGRVCEFPRAMARVRTADGRTGLGWIEWGHNVAAPGRKGVAGYAQRRAQKAKALAEQAAKRLVAQVPDTAFDGLMNSRAGRLVTAAIFKALPGLINKEAADGLDAIVRFKIRDAASGDVDTYDLVLPAEGASITVQRPSKNGTAARPRITLTLTAADLLALGTGRLDATNAALTRRILVEGDVHFVPSFAAVMASGAKPGVAGTRVGQPD